MLYIGFNNKIASFVFSLKHPKKFLLLINFVKKTMKIILKLPNGIYFYNTHTHTHIYTYIKL